MNIPLKSSLEAEVLDQIVVDAQNFLDLADKLDVDKSQGQLVVYPRILKEFQGEIVELLVKVTDFQLQRFSNPLKPFIVW